MKTQYREHGIPDGIESSGNPNHSVMVYGLYPVSCCSRNETLLMRVNMDRKVYVNVISMSVCCLKGFVKKCEYWFYSCHTISDMVFKNLQASWNR